MASWQALLSGKRVVRIPYMYFTRKPEKVNSDLGLELRESTNGTERKVRVLLNI